jgi:thioredoxin 2
MIATDMIQADERGVVVACPQCGRRNRLTYERLGRTFRCGQCHTELKPPGEPIGINSEAMFRAVTSGSELPVLIDFWASWCGPCQMMAPELDKVAGQAAGRWLVVKVNTDELSSLSQRFRIDSIPTLAVFKAGHEVARQPGAMPGSGIREFMERAIRL